MPDAHLLWTALTRSIESFVMVLDRDFRILFLNHAGNGQPEPSSLLGRPMLDFVAPEIRESVQQTLRELFASGGTASYEVMDIDPQGGRTPYSARAGAVIDGDTVVALIVTATDVRWLHATEQTLRSQRRTLRQMLQTQERERQVLSYEIHDGLAQYQAGAIMQLEAAIHAMQCLPGAQLDDIRRSCEEGLQLVRAAAEEARRLINGLRPPMLDELGIEEAVESLVERMRGTGPAIDYVHPQPLQRLDADVETALFRIVQESLSNIGKHSRARHAHVTMEPLGDDQVRVCISDDGIGFDTGAVPADRFGLEGIRQRARLFGREAAITSVPGGGTRIEVTLPRRPGLVRDDARD